MTAAILAAVAAWLLFPGPGRLRTRVRFSGTRASASPPRVLALGALAAELRAGRAPAQAMRECAGPTWPRTRLAAEHGTDISCALDDDGEPALAACWRISEGAGAGLANSVDRLAAAERDAARVRDEVRAQLAAPRASARVLAILPIIGIAMGAALGADPMTFLLGSGWGRMCMVLAAGFVIAGLAWTSRLATTVERML